MDQDIEDILNRNRRNESTKWVTLGGIVDQESKGNFTVVAAKYNFTVSQAIALLAKYFASGLITPDTPKELRELREDLITLQNENKAIREALTKSEGEISKLNKKLVQITEFQNNADKENEKEVSKKDAAIEKLQAEKKALIERIVQANDFLKKQNVKTGTDWLGSGGKILQF